MAYITEQMLFDYMEESAQPLDLDELAYHFDAVRQDEILKAATALEMKGLVNRSREDRWSLSDKAKALIKEQAEQQKKEREWKDIEMESKKIEIVLAQSNLEANQIQKKAAMDNRKFALINIAIGALNIALLVWQLLRAAL